MLVILLDLFQVLAHLANHQHIVGLKLFVIEQPAFLEVFIHELPELVEFGVDAADILGLSFGQVLVGGELDGGGHEAIDWVAALGKGK